MNTEVTVLYCHISNKCKDRKCNMKDSECRPKHYTIEALKNKKDRI